MAEIENDTTQELVSDVKVRRFQWTSSEKIGVVEIYDKEAESAGMNWIVFKSGNRVNKELVKNLMYELGENEPALQIDSNFDNNQHDASITNGIDPTAGLTTAPSAKASTKISPVRTLLEKQAKHEVNMPFNLMVTIPKSDIFAILKDSFDDAEDELILMLLDKVNVNNLKEQLKDKITDFVKEYYKL